MAQDNNILLHIEEISKRFEGVQALDRVSMDVRAGEVHALVGENGAGKSTLMKIIYGVYQRDSGRIIFSGEDLVAREPADAMRKGIAMVPQEVALFDHVSVMENLSVAREPRGLLPGTVSWAKMQDEAAKLLTRVRLQAKPETLASRLSVAQKQMVVIARALGFDVKLLLMDEPTSALTDVEVAHLFELIQELKTHGVSILYVSHKLREVFTIADRITVFRDGRRVAGFDAKHATPDEVVRMMVGRQLSAEHRANLGECSSTPLLEVKNAAREGVLYDINLTVHRGEIVGLFGLVGAGRTELARAIFGRDQLDRGEVHLDGKKVKLHSPTDGLRYGIGLVPEDRKDEGIMANLTVCENASVTILAKLSRLGLVDRQAERKAVQDIINKLQIRTPSDRQKIISLSGGNQQKVVLGRWLLARSKVLILDEPTHGIDVGTKAQIHELMDQLAHEGTGILFISSELPELLGFCDRIVLLHEGRVVGEFDGRTATEEAIMAAIMRTRLEQERPPHLLPNQARSGAEQPGVG